MAWQGNGMGAAWARHAICESAFNLPTAKFEVLAEVLLKIQIFCDVRLCYLVNSFRCFAGT